MQNSAPGLFQVKSVLLSIKSVLIVTQIYYKIGIGMVINLHNYLHYRITLTQLHVKIYGQVWKRWSN